MPQSFQEDKILLAIQAIHTSTKKLSQRRAAEIFGVPRKTLSDRMKGISRRATIHTKQHKMDPVEEQVLVQYLLDQDARGFGLRLAGLEDMANLLLRSRGGQPVGKHWARRFVDSQPLLKTRYNRPYDYQRALNEDPTVISGWFTLLRNMMGKYGIQLEDLYNFDETGFMMGVITASLIITHSEKRGKAKAIQPGNREWSTVIECINASGWCIPPFVIVKGTYHLANWSTESGLSDD